MALYTSNGIFEVQYFNSEWNLYDQFYFTRDFPYKNKLYFTSNSQYAFKNRHCTELNLNSHLPGVWNENKPQIVSSQAFGSLYR